MELGGYNIGIGVGLGFLCPPILPTPLRQPDLPRRDGKLTLLVSKAIELLEVLAEFSSHPPSNCSL